ncbi:MAG: histidine phosphatase family protein [Halomonas sp.]|uniref:histidine phosphatase family protein n=1 Tax=Halomonas sp. TaxID=1486246 RepID=UPI002ACE4251|nr:histidine phosphatase family protein [Halomonas sp.]MDZ7851802.1 histidine phosphatase family protein [Halomonas sp.]
MAAAAMARMTQRHGAPRRVVWWWPCLWSILVAGQIMAAEPDEEAAAWRALAQGGHVALMRHALAPGIGDPSGFRLEACNTQRNLSADGREQARRIGERFRDRGIEVAEVRSSRWCRCLETARMLGLGKVVPTPALDSFFRDRSQADDRTRAARALIHDWDGEGTLVLVTHQVNISSLVGGGVGSGEIIVVRPSEAGLAKVGRIR